jgi:hypothetical protein
MGTREVRSDDTGLAVCAILLVSAVTFTYWLVAEDTKKEMLLKAERQLAKSVVASYEDVMNQELARYGCPETKRVACTAITNGDDPMTWRQHCEVVEQEEKKWWMLSRYF